MMNLFKNEYQDTLNFEFGFNGNLDLKDKPKKKRPKGNSGNFFSQGNTKKESKNKNKIY